MLNIPVPSDQSMQDDCALNLHLLGQRGYLGSTWRERICGTPGERWTRAVASAAPTGFDVGWAEDARAGAEAPCVTQVHIYRIAACLDCVPFWSPVTTSTPNGGRTARLVTTGADAGAEFGSPAAAVFGVCVFDFGDAGTAGCVVVTAGSDWDFGSGEVCSSGSDADCSPRGGREPEPTVFCRQAGSARPAAASAR